MQNLRRTKTFLTSDGDSNVRSLVEDIDGYLNESELWPAQKNLQIHITYKHYPNNWQVVSDASPTGLFVGGCCLFTIRWNNSISCGTEWGCEKMEVRRAFLKIKAEMLKPGREDVIHGFSAVLSDVWRYFLWIEKAVVSLSVKQMRTDRIGTVTVYCTAKCDVIVSVDLSR